MFTGIRRRHSKLITTLGPSFDPVLVRGEFAVIPSCFPSFLLFSYALNHRIDELR
jgi:hypothetical protein